MHYPTGYKVEGKEFKEFKELDNERALKLIALIYNVRTETWEDGMARSIALEEYQKLISKRSSAFVKNSGILKIEYTRANIPQWKDADLVKLYDTLNSKTADYYMNSAPELSEMQNVKRIMYVTAMNSIVKELKKRENTKTVVSVASQILLTALSTALSMI
jgi:hypothetical protein